MYRGLGPLRTFLRNIPWPVEAVPMPPPAGDLLDRVLVLKTSLDVLPRGYVLWAAVAWEHELVFGIPGLDIVTLAVGSEVAALVEVELPATNDVDVDEAALGGDAPIRFVEDPPTPPQGYTSAVVSLELSENSVLAIHDIAISVRFAPAVLKPVALNPGDEMPPYASITLRGSAEIDASLNVRIHGFDEVSLAPAMIGSSGVILAAEGVELNLLQSNPEIRMRQATVLLPQDLFPAELLPALPQLILDDARIDARGFNGSVTAEWPLELDEDTGAYQYRLPKRNDDGSFVTNPDGSVVQEVRESTLFGLPGGLRHVGLRIEQNQLTGCDITGALIIPYFDEPVEVRLNITPGGRFVVALLGVDESGITLTKEELLALNLKSLTVSTSDETAAVVVSGGLEPLLMASDGLRWPRLEVTDLYVDSAGKFRIAEAWVDLKDLATLDLWGFHFELNRIGLGYQETDDKLWIDLAGSLRLIEQIPVGLGVEGFRLTWPRTLFDQLSIEGPPTLDQAIAIASELEVKFDGVYLFYGVPGAVEFEGLISFIKDARVVGFAGNMALRVPATGLAAEAGLMVGMNLVDPPYPFLYVYFGIELPAGIPLGQSGLALKGALGLFGLNVSPDKTPEQNWYYDWYKRGPIAGAHPTNKWRNERNALAVGIGLTITTVDGYVKGVRGLLVLAIPGPILIIEGRALIFNGLTPAEPPLRALAVIDGREKIIQFSIEAEAELVEDMIDAYGMLEAFFDFKDLTNWHLYLGQDEPRDRRIRANILKFQDAFLFKADAYLMVDMIGAHTLRSRMGVFVGFKPPIPDIGPVKITLDAVLEGHGEITLLPEQFSGDVDLSANVELEAFGFGLQLAASGGVLTEGPKPLKVDAEVTVSAELPGLDPLKETFEFSWEAQEPPEITAPLVAVTADSPFAPGGGALKIEERAGVQSSNVWLPAAENSPVAPIDTRPILAFGHEMNDHARVPIGNNRRPAFVRHPDGIAKMYDVGLMRFTPTLKMVRLYEHRKGKPWPATLDGWTLIASSRDADVGGAVARLPGVWMAEADPQDPANPTARRLHLWTNNPLLHSAATLGSGYPPPFDIISPGRLPAGSSHAEQLLDLQPDLMKCAFTEAKRVCVDFVDAVGTKLKPGVIWEHHDLELKPLSDPASVQRDARGPTCLVGRGRLSVRFPEPVIRVWIRFCVMPKLAGVEPSVLIDIARTARTSKELKEIAEEAKKKGTAADLTACRYPVVHQVAVEIDTWIISATQGFDCLAMFKTHDFSIAEICYVTATESERSARAAAQCVANDEADTEPQVILQPGSYYRLDIETTVAGKPGGGGDNKLVQLYAAILQGLNLDNTVKSYRHVAFFQTEGPPTSLLPYVKWTSPVPKATRVFRTDSLAIRFLRPNLQEMYGHAQHHLEMLVRSARGRLVGGYDTVWIKAGSASLLLEEQLWREHRSAVGLPIAPVEADDVLKARRASAELEPNARYELMVTGGEGGTLLFEDGFEGLSSETWQPDVTGWNAEHGVLVREDNGPAHITVGERTWTDVDVVVELRLTNRRGGGVLVRASSTQRPGAVPVWNACRIDLSQNLSGIVALRLQALQGDTEASGSVAVHLLHSAIVTLQPGLWYRLRVSVVANRVRVWVFDDLLVEGTLYRLAREWTSQGRRPGTLIWFSREPSGAALGAIQRGDLLPSTQGKVGLHAAGAGPEFRRMRVRDAVLHRTSFTTSAFDGFCELVGSGRTFDPVAIMASIPTPQLKRTALEASAQLANALWVWHRAEIDYRFEELKRGREALEEFRLAVREARAIHDAAFRALAEAVAPNILYLPLSPHVEVYLLRNSTGRLFGLWMRSPESLDLRQHLRDEAGNLTDNHVGRTTITVTRGSALDVDILHDADDTQILILRKNSAVWPGGPCRVTFTYHRNHGDETGEANHRYDRPVESGGTSDVEAVEVTFNA
jgi:hypothetical protein